MTSPIINFGRHRGQAVADLPEHYLRWLVDPARGKPQADQPSRPIPPKILSAAQDQLDFIEQEKLRELFAQRSEEHTSELQSLMRISYAVFCLKKKKNNYNTQETSQVIITQLTNNHTY